MSLLLVIGQERSGRAIPLDESPKSIGRHPKADLVVTDASVSRRHLEALRSGDAVEIRTVDEAAPFLWRGKPTKVARLEAGESVIVGSTVLTVFDEDKPSVVVNTSHLDVATMFEGLAVEVRGFAAVVRLVESLRSASDREAVSEVVRAWPERAGFARAATLIETDAPLETLVVDGKVLTMPVPGFAMALRVEASRVDDALRGILLVGAQSVAARLGEIGSRTALEEDVRALRVAAMGSARDFLGDSAATREVARIVPKLAASSSTALLLGESGTGKTFVARLIHEASARRSEPLRVVNCAAIPENLVESELFGAERGAFSGAVSSRAGAFEAAGAGTLLLDELGELPLQSQAKLLRVLEDRCFERIGSNKSLPLEARVIAATNRDLEAMVAAGTFRADLLFRVGVVTLRVPSLRERGDDVVGLARRLLEDLASTTARRVDGFTPAAIEAIKRYGWPGNVRELRNAIEHALVLGEEPTIDALDLPANVRGAKPIATTTSRGTTVTLPANLAELEELAIKAALEATNGNRTHAAALLGINRVTLQKKLRRE